jgi:hypothetical protein
MVIVIYKPLLLDDAVGISPSFSHQQITDPINDWFLIDNPADLPVSVDKAKNISECKLDKNRFPSPDISGITYISDGRHLNGTFWLSSPLQEPTIDYQENFAISVDYPGSHITLDDYLNNTINEYNSTALDFKVVESDRNNSTLFGKPAYKLVWAEKEDNINYKKMEIGTFIGDKVYFIIYTAEEDNYDYYLPSIEQMVNSLEIADFLIYQDPVSEISIKYPSSWSWTKGDISSFAPILGTTYNSSVWFYPPSDTYSTVLVQVENLPSNNISLNDYVNENIRYLKENSQDFDLVNSTIITLADNSRAHRTVYTYDIQGTLYKSSIIVSIKNDKVYYIGYDAEAEKYPEYLATLQQILDSLEIEADTLILNNANKTLQSEDLDDLIYQNTTYGIKMEYPSNWNNYDSTDYTDDRVTNIVTFYSPIEGLSYMLKSYTMNIDILSTHDEGLDYTANVQWDDISKNWTTAIEESGESPIPGSNTIYRKDNYTGFYNIDDSGNNYIRFSLDLGLINYPTQYQVIFSITDLVLINDRFCRMADFTNTVSIPPPKFNMTTSPSSLILKPGDQKNIELKITSNTDSDSQAFLFADEIDGLELNFIPNNISVPSFGQATSILEVKALEDVKPRPYTIPIHRQISFSGGATHVGTDVFINDSGTLDIFEDLYLTITVLPQEYNITASPNSLELRPGEEKDIEVKIKSETNLNSYVKLYAKRFQPLEVTFSPDETYIPPLGLSTSILHIKVPNNAKVHPYTFPLLGNFSIQRSEINEEIYNEPSNSIEDNIITKNIDLTISLLPPLTHEEHLNNFYKAWISPLSGIWTFVAGISAVIIPWIIRRYNRREKHRNIEDYT